MEQENLARTEASLHISNNNGSELRKAAAAVQQAVISKKHQDISSKQQMASSSKQQMVSMDPPRTLIISVPGSAEGMRRAALRGPLAANEQYITGYTEVPKYVVDKFAGRHKGETLKSSLGCLYSHMMAWEKIASDNIASIILEDDAIMCRAVNYEVVLKSQSLVLLGGVVRTPGAWAREQSEYVETEAYLHRVQNFQVGLKSLDTNKFTGSIAYWMPVGVAKALVAHVQKVAHYRVADIFLRSSVDDILLHFPNAYKELPGCKSQCNSPPKDLGGDLFMSRHFQKHAGAKFEALLAKYPYGNFGKTTVAELSDDVAQLNLDSQAGPSEPDLYLKID